MSEDEFTIPLPPPPPGTPPHDVVFVRHGGPEAGTKDYEDIMLRRVPRDTAMRFRGSAGGRGLTHAQYLTALVDLHRRARELADAGDERLGHELDELGLASVTV
jgi:hypothetical protein